MTLEMEILSLNVWLLQRLAMLAEANRYATRTLPDPDPAHQEGEGG